MIEYGLEECLDTRPSVDMASSTLTIRSAGSGLDEFLEVHYHSARVEEGEVVEASAQVIERGSQSSSPTTVRRQKVIRRRLIFFALAKTNTIVFYAKHLIIVQRLD